MPPIEYSSTGRHEQKLQQAEHGGQHAIPERAHVGALDKLPDQQRQHGHDEANAEHVDEHADQHEIEVAAGRLRHGGRTGHGHLGGWRSPILALRQRLHAVSKR
jgi:hypothetical protein